MRTGETRAFVLGLAVASIVVGCTLEIERSPDGCIEIERVIRDALDQEVNKSNWAEVFGQGPYSDFTVRQIEILFDLERETRFVIVDDECGSDGFGVQAMTFKLISRSGQRVHYQGKLLDGDLTLMTFFLPEIVDAI